MVEVLPTNRRASCESTEGGRRKEARFSTWRRWGDRYVGSVRLARGTRRAVRAAGVVSGLASGVEMSDRRRGVGRAGVEVSDGRQASRRVGRVRRRGVGRVRRRGVGRVRRRGVGRVRRRGVGPTTPLTGTVLVVGPHCRRRTPRPDQPSSSRSTRPVRGLGQKNVVLGGMRAPPRPIAAICSTVTGRRRMAASAWPAATAAAALSHPC